MIEEYRLKDIEARYLGFSFWIQDVIDLFSFIRELQAENRRYRKALEEIEIKIETPPNGSPVYKDWHPICLSCDYIHGLARKALAGETAQKEAK